MHINISQRDYTVTKNLQKLIDKATVFIAELEERYELHLVKNKQVSIRVLKKYRKRLYAIKEQNGIIFVHGSGRRKTPLQRAIETLENLLSKLKEYTHKSMYVENVAAMPKQTRMPLPCV